FWASSSDAALSVTVGLGILCSLLLVANVLPRAMTAACTVLFLSFIAVLRDFSSYQSDGMLLQAGFVSIFFAPGGLRPGFGAGGPARPRPPAFSWGGGGVSLFSCGPVLVTPPRGPRHWRDFTAMDDYYQNGPLPAWPGWYVQHLPHWYHAGTVAATLLIELLV